MSFDQESDSKRIRELEKTLSEVLDSELSATGGNDLSLINGTLGNRNAASGDSGGIRSNQPIIHSITDVDEDDVSTGVFDKINIISSMAIIQHTSSTFDLRFIQGVVKDGTRIKITSKIGQTGTIKSGGNILTSIDIVIADTEFFELVKYSEAETGVTGGAWKIFKTVTGSSTIPDGTIENQHLEWDNSGLSWVAVESSIFGATGPFADSGFLRFANDQIMLSSRNNIDTGNGEFKFDSANFFDLTRSDEQPVLLQLRAQHATNPDQLFQFTQFSGTGAISNIGVPTKLGFQATTVDVFNYDQNRIETNVNILPDVDGTLQIGGVFDRFLAVYAAEFSFDTSRGLNFNTGGATLNVDGASDTFIISVNSVQRALFTSSLTTLSGNVNVLGNLEIGGFLDIPEIATPANPDPDVGRLYVKDVSTITTLFFRDNAGNETNVFGLKTDLSNMTSPTIPPVDLSLNTKALVDVGFIIMAGSSGMIDGISQLNFTTLNNSIITESNNLKYIVSSGQEHEFSIAGQGAKLTISQLDINVHDNNIINTGDVKPSGQVHTLGDTSDYFAEVYADNILPQSSSVDNNLYGLAKTGNTLYVNYNNVDADAGFGIYEEGIRQFLFYNPSSSVIELFIGPDPFNLGETYRIQLGENSNSSAKIELTEGNNDLIIDRQGVATTRAIDLRTGGISRLLVSSTESKFLSTVNVDSEDIINVRDVFADTSGTSTIGEFQPSNGGFDYVVRERISWELDTATLIQFSLSGIAIASDDSIFLNSNDNQQFTTNTAATGMDFFPDGTLAMSIRDNAVTLQTGTSLFVQGNFASYTEIVTPTNPSANNGRMYAKDVGGITTPMWLDSTGTETSLLGGGSTSFIGFIADADLDMGTFDIVADVIDVAGIFGVNDLNFANVDQMITSSASQLDYIVDFNETHNFWIGASNVMIIGSTIDLNVDLVMDGNDILLDVNQTTIISGFQIDQIDFLTASSIRMSITNSAILMSEELSMLNLNRITNVDDPINPQDVVTLQYFNDNVAGTPNFISQLNSSATITDTGTDGKFEVILDGTSHIVADESNIFRLNNGMGFVINEIDGVSGDQFSMILFPSAMELDISSGLDHVFKINGLVKFFISDTVTNSLNPLNLNGNLIINVDDPVDPQDVVTKAYGDANYLGGGGSQTPWTSDIDADGFNLLNLDRTEYQIGLFGASTTPFSVYDGTNLRWHVPSGDGFVWTIGAFDQILGLGASTINVYKEIDMQSLNKIINLEDPTADQDAATKKYVDDNSTVLDGIQDAKIWTTHETFEFDFECWHTNNKNGDLGSSIPLATDTAFYIPIYVGKDVTLREIGIDITTAGASTVTLAIYDSEDTQNYPRNRIVTSSSTNNLSLGTGIRTITFFETLPAGLYFLLVRTSSGISIRQWNPDLAESVGHFPAGGNTGTMRPICGYSDLLTSSTPDASADDNMDVLNGGAELGIPAIYARFSS